MPDSGHGHLWRAGRKPGDLQASLRGFREPGWRGVRATAPHVVIARRRTCGASGVRGGASRRWRGRPGVCPHAEIERPVFLCLPRAGKRGRVPVAGAPRERRRFRRHFMERARAVRRGAAGRHPVGRRALDRRTRTELSELDRLRLPGEVREGEGGVRRVLPGAFADVRLHVAGELRLGVAQAASARVHPGPCRDPPGRGALPVLPQRHRPGTAAHAQDFAARHAYPHISRRRAGRRPDRRHVRRRHDRRAHERPRIRARGGGVRDRRRQVAPLRQVQRAHHARVPQPAA